jgi:hypothetical protein
MSRSANRRSSPMKRVLQVFFLTGISILPALGQEPNPGMYLFAAPGLAIPGSRRTVGLGGGIEGIVSDRLSKSLWGNFEMSYLAPADHFGDGRGLLSVDASYFVPRHAAHFKIQPFFEGGYTRAFGPGSANMVNFGSGFNYWFHFGSGIRFEFRDHVQPGTPARHYPQFRVGWAFPMPTR